MSARFLLRLWSGHKRVVVSCCASRRKTLECLYTTKANVMTRNTQLQEKEKVPPGPKSLPLIGTLYKYLPYIGPYSIKDQQRTDTRRYKSYGPVVREEVLPGQVMYYIYDPALFAEVFSYEPKYPVRFPMEGIRAYRESRGQHPGFPNAVGKEWHKIRQPANQLMLKPSVVSYYTEKQDNVAKDMIHLMRLKRNEKNEVDELLSILYRFGMESIGVVIFDRRLGTLLPNQSPGSEGETFVSAANEVFHSIYETTFFWPLHKNKKTQTWKQLERGLDYVSHLTKKYLRESLKRAENDGAEGNSFLQSYIRKLDMDPDRVTGVLCDFFYAGVDTVAYTTAFSMYHLAKHPRIQDTLYAEICEVVKPGTPVTYAKLENMKYLKAVVKETFRLTPVSAFGIVRTFEKDIEVAGFRIPAGSFVFMQPNVASHLEEYFPEPEKFKPERWLSSTNDGYKSFPLMPFGYGGRMCLGKRFAEQEIYLSLINILQSFHLEYHYEDIGMQTKFLNQPDKPLRFTLLDRKKPTVGKTTEAGSSQTA